MYKIAITGPESTGKSTLCEQLAEHYNTAFVPEFSREYLNKKNGKYSENDLTEILNGQLKLENSQVSKANKYLFCDTDPLVIWIWSKVKYGKVDLKIEKELSNHKYDLYLLTYPDLPWEEDSLRESEEKLTELFDLYLNKLQELGFPFKIVSGVGVNRLKTAITAIDESI